MKPDLAAVDGITRTEDARRASRFTYAERRIKAIVDGAPPLTAAQRLRLAAILAPVSDLPEAC